MAPDGEASMTTGGPRFTKEDAMCDGLQNQKVIGIPPRTFKNTATVDMTVTITWPEMTWVCPVQGYPDFAHVTIEYAPGDKILELKSLKIWLTAFRNRPIGHERIASEIFETLWTKASPKRLKVVLDINPRGNMKSVITIERTAPGGGP